MKKAVDADSDGEKELFTTSKEVTKDEKDELCDSSSWDSQDYDFEDENISYKDWEIPNLESLSFEEQEETEFYQRLEQEKEFEKRR